MTLQHFCASLGWPHFRTIVTIFFSPVHFLKFSKTPTLEVETPKKVWRWNFSWWLYLTIQKVPLNDFSLLKLEKRLNKSTFVTPHNLTLEMFDRQQTFYPTNFFGSAYISQCCIVKFDRLSRCLFFTSFAWTSTFSKRLAGLYPVGQSSVITCELHRCICFRIEYTRSNWLFFQLLYQSSFKPYVSASEVAIQLLLWKHVFLILVRTLRLWSRQSFRRPSTRNHHY